MKHFSLCKYQAVIPLAVLSILPAASAQVRPVAPAIVTRYCSGCHELNGKSQLPYIPKLAGQNAAYVLRKLATFRAADSAPVDEAVSLVAGAGSTGRPGNTGNDVRITGAASVHMVGVARAVSEADKKAAAEWYAAQMPAPGKSGQRKLIEEGRNLFINGVQSQGLTACQTCHGPDAHGNDRAPRLAGQSAAYVISQLALFREADPHHSPEMTVVAKAVEGDQARAVAVYVQSLGTPGK